MAAADVVLRAGLEHTAASDPAQADLVSRLGWLQVRRGEVVAGTALLERALAQARATTDAEVERRSMLDLALADALLARHAEARELLADSIERARAAGDTAASYRHNYQRLAQIKRTYDPDNLFRMNQNIKPAAV